MRLRVCVVVRAGRVVILDDVDCDVPTVWLLFC